MYVGIVIIIPLLCRGGGGGGGGGGGAGGGGDSKKLKEIVKELEKERAQLSMRAMTVHDLFTHLLIAIYLFIYSFFLIIRFHLAMFE